MKERVEYYSIKIDSKEEMSWVYSATGFQELLNKEFSGQTLKCLFVSLYGYLDSSEINDEHFDFSYIGGVLLLVFSSSVLELAIHAEGMVEYRILPVCEVEIPEKGTIDYPPSGLMLKEDNYYYDLGKELCSDCIGQRLKMIEIKKTDAYPFDLEGFDEMRADDAGNQGELPESVELFMDNDVTIKLRGVVEYFDIILDKNRE